MLRKVLLTLALLFSVFVAQADYAQQLALSRQLSEKDPERAIAIAKELLDSVQREQNRLMEAEARHSIGIAMRKLGQYNSAVDQILIASKIFASLNKPKLQAETFNTLGLIRSAQGQFALSLELHIKALEIRRRIEDKWGIAISYNNLGNSFRNAGELDKSIEYLMQSIEIKESLDRPASLAHSYNNLGHTYRRMEDFSSARDYYVKALDIRKDINNQSGVASSLNNIGTLLHLEGNYEEALTHFQQSLEMRRALGDKISELGTLNNIGSTLNKMGRHEDALQTLFSVLDADQISGAPVIRTETLQLISQTYEDMASYAQALSYHQQYFDEYTKLFNEANSKQLMNIQADFGVKENELKVQYLQELTEAEKKARKTENTLLGVALVLLVFVLFLLVQRHRFTVKSKTKLQTLNADLEAKTAKLAEANDSLAELSKTDSLTNIFNRRVFDETIEKQLLVATRKQEPLSLFIVDIDYFKHFNDEFGHQQGDKALIKVAEILGTICKRPEDTVCRYGGEEFAIVLANTPQAGAQQVAESLRSHVERANIESSAISPYPFLTISIGVFTLVPDENSSVEFIIGRADKALFSAKKLGRNQVVSVV
ncbi:diguanylate cyclase [Alteromonas sediminis]|uniref:diguanylate cyclase n=1 Tax=Alteromonas sediminis TaxID=2259342 RepID=A0A3N5XX11_9ALTE|nr:tetratricopeptide repeat-containing diguanylate cyclase [Alteromonas sediminis]RPJ65282.1 diguanylate cyclase [Alteromonas sediminis]